MTTMSHLTQATAGITAQAHRIMQRADALARQHNATRRADAQGPQMSPYRVVIAEHLQARADHHGFDLDSPEGKAWFATAAGMLLNAGGGRADAQYYDGQLRTLYDGASALMVPRQNLDDILQGIPVRQVAVGSKTYALRTKALSGKAKPYAANATSYPRPNRNVDESEGQTSMWCFEIPDEWLTSMYDSFAGMDRAADDLDQMRRAFAEAEWDVRLNGFRGGVLAGITDAGIPHLTSAQQYLPATAVDVLFEDMINLVQQGRLQSKTDGRYDTIIMTDRVDAAIGLSNNLSAGGSAVAKDLILRGLQAEGITRVIVGKSLRDLTGEDVDDCLLFNSGARGGLKQVRQMNPTPVKTYPGPNGDYTVYAASWGGLEIPVPETALRLSLPVA